MKKILEFIITQITGSDKFTIEETEEESTLILNVKAPTEHLGLIIGKEGKTIKNIRRILSIKGVQEKKNVQIKVAEITG